MIKRDVTYSELNKYCWTEDNRLQVVQPYEGQINPGEPSFYYHSDHLGSASFLTDRDGYETQQLVYLPFGEDWVDMKYNTSQYDTPYKFNGKEKDQETGYQYFGARYLNPTLSIWLSVDPLSDKYPHLTSYNYCANNPVMLIDPDGRAFGPPWKNKGPVIPKEKFVGWKNQPFYNNFKRQNNRDPNCLDYSKAQMNVAGYTTGGAKDPTNMYTYDEKTGANAVVTAKAVEYIKSQIENDRPVLIGADRADNQGINEGTTDHFMVVVGMGNDKKGNYFTVYDNASGKDPDKEGASPENKLYYDEKKNTISGRTKTSYSQDAEKDYTVSQVRETKELN